MEYNILLNAHIDDISSLCETHRIFNDICHDKRFWFDRFEHDQLPMIEMKNNVTNWIEEYETIRIYNQIIEHGRHSLSSFWVYFTSDQYELMLKILPATLLPMIYPFNPIHDYEITVINHRVKLEIYGKKLIRRKTIEMDQKSIRLLLIKLFYYHISFHYKNGQT